MVRVPNLPLSMTVSANVISGPSKRSSPLFYVAPRMGTTQRRSRNRQYESHQGDALTLATSRSSPNCCLVIHHSGPASFRPAPSVLHKVVETHGATVATLAEGAECAPV